MFGFRIVWSVRCWRDKAEKPNGHTDTNLRHKRRERSGQQKEYQGNFPLVVT